jgi:DNA-binding response OmpR family regulator
VLVVERDHATAQAYKIGLLLNGFKVEIARDGEEGIEQALTGLVPEAVVVDLGLPRIDRGTPRKDGFDLVSTLSSCGLARIMPVIALSSDGQSWEEAFRRGATHCLPKWNVTGRDLGATVRRLVESW